MFMSPLFAFEQENTQTIQNICQIQDNKNAILTKEIF